MVKEGYREFPSYGGRALNDIKSIMANPPTMPMAGLPDWKMSVVRASV